MWTERNVVGWLLYLESSLCLPFSQHTFIFSFLTSPYPFLGSVNPTGHRPLYAYMYTHAQACTRRLDTGVCLPSQLQNGTQVCEGRSKEMPSTAEVLSKVGGGEAGRNGVNTISSATVDLWGLSGQSLTSELSNMPGGSFNYR